MSENSQASPDNQVNLNAPNVGAYSVKQFCSLYNISPAHFYNLKTANLAPDIFKVGNRTLISVDAAIRWCKCMEDKTSLDKA